MTFRKVLYPDIAPEKTAPENVQRNYDNELYKGGMVTLIKARY